MYQDYCNFIQSIIDSNDLTNFKYNPNYNCIVEHLNEELGNEYLKLLVTIFKEDDIIRFCDLNDSVGNPRKYNYTHNGISFSGSPSSLRYLYHAHLILTYLKKVGNLKPNLIELGGGYGGLILALNYLQYRYNVLIQSYKIIDLKNPTLLQRMYLNNFRLSFPFETEDASSFGSEINQNKNNFLISNYAFSEFDPDTQQKYIENNLFEKVDHGFLIWNDKPVFNFGKIYRSEPENPQTDVFRETNLYVYF